MGHLARAARRTARVKAIEKAQHMLFINMRCAFLLDLMISD